MLKGKLQGRIQVKTSSHSVIHRDLNPPKSVPFFDRVAIATSFIFSVLPVPPAFLISHPKIRRGCTQMNRTILTDCLLQSFFSFGPLYLLAFPPRSPLGQTQLYLEGWDNLIDCLLQNLFSWFYICRCLVLKSEKECADRCSLQCVLFSLHRFVSTVRLTCFLEEQRRKGNAKMRVKLLLNPQRFLACFCPFLM